jgi:hypothetical protein
MNNRKHMVAIRKLISDLLFSSSNASLECLEFIYFYVDRHIIIIIYLKVQASVLYIASDVPWATVIFAHDFPRADFF